MIRFSLWQAIFPSLFTSFYTSQNFNSRLFLKVYFKIDTVNNDRPVLFPVFLLWLAFFETLVTVETYCILGAFYKIVSIQYAMQMMLSALSSVLTVGLSMFPSVVEAHYHHTSIAGKPVEDSYFPHPPSLLHRNTKNLRL